MSTEVALVFLGGIFIFGLVKTIELLFNGTDWLIDKIRGKKRTSYEKKMDSLVRKYYDAGYDDHELGNERRTSNTEWDKGR